jgi:hypothetical protein
MESAIVALTPRETELVYKTHYLDESSLGYEKINYVTVLLQNCLACCENLLVFIFMASRFINICLSKLAVSSLVAPVMPKFWRGFVMVICA